MPTVEANDQTLYYEDHGEGEPLVCVMGLAADVLAWTLQLPAFSAAHRAIVFDNRDAGRSSQSPGPYEVADMARDTLALADAVGLDSVHQLSREEHIDELMLLNHSEAFYENPEGVAYVRGMMLQNPHPQPPEAFCRQLAASSRHDARDRLGSLALPVHVIGCERDLLVPVWKSQELAELIPGA